MNTKTILVVLAATTLSACTKPNRVEFDVTATGLNDGVFVIKNQGTQTIFGQNIKNGKCTIGGMLEEPGFYTVDILKNGGKEHHFEIYLEPGKYTITTTADNLNKYPKIESESKKQEQVSNYNMLYEQSAGKVRQESQDINDKLENGKATLSMDAIKNLTRKAADAADKGRSIEYDILETYVKKYPESDLSTHFMAQQDYGLEPEKYNKLFNTLSATAKSSEDGKEIAQKLNLSLKLQPGNKAPAIAGKTFDGKSFADITKGKKIFLIDFWRSVNQVSRVNHERIQTAFNNLNGKGFQVISVSLDKKELWWTTAVKDDKLPWPQMSDLKGNDSPNAANWNITTIPTYYLVDKDWKIYKKDITLGGIELEASQYLEKHR